MLRIIPIILSMSLFGCSTLTTNETNLFEKYQGLSEEISNGSVLKNRSTYFSKYYLSEVTESDEKSHFVLKMPGQLKTPTSHFQSFKNGIGCLTVNGKDSEGYPVSIFIEYTSENSDWLVNYMYLNMIEDESSFESKAVCPREIE